MYVRVYTYVCMCVYVCMHVCVYVCMYVCIHRLLLHTKPCRAVMRDIHTYIDLYAHACVLHNNHTLEICIATGSLLLFDIIIIIVILIL